MQEDHKHSLVKVGCGQYACSKPNCDHFETHDELLVLATSGGSLSKKTSSQKASETATRKREQKVIARS